MVIVMHMLLIAGLKVFQEALDDRYTLPAWSVPLADAEALGSLHCQLVYLAGDHRVLRSP